MTDSRDNNIYKTVLIGDQTWMAENLNFNFRNSSCYGDDPANCALYGRLYDWESATVACPSEWHLPSNSDWDRLISEVGDSSTAGTRLKSLQNWSASSGLIQGTDDYGFSALPAGFYGSTGYDYLGYYGKWWTSTEYYDSGIAYYRLMLHSSENVGTAFYNKTSRYSVRCIKG